MVLRIEKTEDIDKDLLIRVIRLVPDLEIVAFAGALTREHGMSYPLKSLDHLMAIFDGAETIELHGHGISTEQVKKYFKQFFFPIDSEEDFLMKVYLAMCIQAREASLNSHLNVFETATPVNISEGR